MDDYISRQAAIDAIVNTVSEVGNHDNSEVARYGATFRQHEILDIIESLPSVQPRKGKWIDDGTEFGCCCSECNYTLDDYFYGELREVALTKLMNFCPNCGADMREG